MNLALARALRVPAAPSIAFVGAGGKTTALFQLARTLSKAEGEAPVIVTATSHLGAWQIHLADEHVMTDTPAPLEKLEHGLKGVILITGALEEDRTKPIPNDLLNWLHQFCAYHAIPLLIEADGSREKPLKAWATHEPPIPAFVELVVQLVGLTGLGRPASEEYIHRAELFARLSGQPPGTPVSLNSVARVLVHPEGGLKNIPRHARRAVILNQAETFEIQSAAQALAQLLLPSYDSVIIASLQQEQVFAVHEPVAGIILAAGASRRYGQPKQLLDWKGQPFVRAVALTALNAGLSPITVVTGANAAQVESAISDLAVGITRNDEWERGQGSSIREGIWALTQSTPSLSQTRQQKQSVGEDSSSRLPGGVRKIERVGGAIFLLTDQPQVTTSVLRALVERHAQGLYPIVAPMVMDRRANPVLFDRDTFRDLSALEGDVGGRAVFHKYSVEYLPWHDDRLLLDVDTPEMYQRLISDESL